MEMPEGWKRMFEIGYDADGPINPQEYYFMDHKEMGQLMKEMAEALEDLVREAEGDTWRLCDVDERKILDKFKEWK